MANKYFGTDNETLLYPDDSPFHLPYTYASLSSAINELLDLAVYPKLKFTIIHLCYTHHHALFR